jgi:hypothetical protein
MQGDVAAACTFVFVQLVKNARVEKKSWASLDIINSCRVKQTKGGTN